VWKKNLRSQRQQPPWRWRWPKTDPLPLVVLLRLLLLVVLLVAFCVYLWCRECVWRLCFGA